MKHLIVAGVAAGSLALGVGVAQAHPRLLTANPAAGARIRQPSQVQLGFSETLIGRFSRMSLADSAGRPVPLGASTLSPDHKHLVAQVKTKLAPGSYRVSWNVVSTDTHRVQGGYVFTVAR